LGHRGRTTWHGSVQQVPVRPKFCTQK
jgi:hypothetical protein